jgi:hypothetical protein
MSVGKHEWETRLTPEGLAKALRSGLELRWSIPAPPAEETPTSFPPHGDIRSVLDRYAHLLLHSPPRRRHPLRSIVRMVRLVLRNLLTPWLRVQTQFNLSAMSVLEQIEQRIQTLEEAKLSLQQTIETLEKSALSRPQHERNRQVETLEKS